LDRGGVSYTIDTLRQLRRQHPRAELFFLMGSDALGDFPRWREPQAVCEIATPLVVHRAGSPPPDFQPLADIVSASQLEEIKRMQVEMPAMPISSSAIRRQIEEG